MVESRGIPSQLLRKVARGFRLPVPRQVPRFFNAGLHHEETGVVDDSFAADDSAERTSHEATSGVPVRKGTAWISEDHPHGAWEDEGSGITKEESGWTSGVISFGPEAMEAPAMPDGHDPLPVAMNDNVTRMTPESAKSMSVSRAIDLISRGYTRVPREVGSIGVMREDEGTTGRAISFISEGDAPPVVSSVHEDLPPALWPLSQTDDLSPVSGATLNEDGGSSDMAGRRVEGPGFDPGSFEVIDGTRFRRKSGYQGMLPYDHPADVHKETGRPAVLSRETGAIPGNRLATLREDRGDGAQFDGDRLSGLAEVADESPVRHKVVVPIHEQHHPRATETLRSILSNVFPGPAVVNEPLQDVSDPTPDVASGTQKGTVRVGSITIQVKGREEPREEHWPSPPTYADHVITTDWDWACRYGR